MSAFDPIQTFDDELGGGRFQDIPGLSGRIDPEAKPCSVRVESAWYSVAIAVGRRRSGAPEGRAMETVSRRTLMQTMGAGAVALSTPFGKNSTREGDEHPLLGRLQLRPGSRSLPQERGCDGEGREPDQRSDHDKSAARRRDQCLGLDQRQQSLGAQSDVASKADQAAAARSVRALFREYAPGRQGAL